MNNVEARRNFLKKAAYAAPAVMVLGTLVAPMSAHASNLGRTSKGNNGFGNGDQVAPGGSATANGAENQVGSTTPPTTTTAPGKSGRSSAGGKKK